MSATVCVERATSDKLSDRSNQIWIEPPPVIHSKQHSTEDTVLWILRELLARYLLKLIFSPAHLNPAAKFSIEMRKSSLGYLKKEEEGN